MRARSIQKLQIQHPTNSSWYLKPQSICPGKYGLHLILPWIRFRDWAKPQWPNNQFTVLYFIRKCLLAVEEYVLLVPVALKLWLYSVTNIDIEYNKIVLVPDFAWLVYR